MTAVVLFGRIMPCRRTEAKGQVTESQHCSLLLIGYWAYNGAEGNLLISFAFQHCDRFDGVIGKMARYAQRVEVVNVWRGQYGERRIPGQRASCSGFPLREKGFRYLIKITLQRSVDQRAGSALFCIWGQMASA